MGDFGYPIPIIECGLPPEPTDDLPPPKVEEP
jgi:hypothetical protein